ncbi:class II fructose-bisphosphate aldolase [Flavobacteriaceae bacterium]|nr:class II fructose-bisphosphate aldolase [Flavobacteriaceae bacterium]
MKKKIIEVLKNCHENNKSLLAFNVQNIYHLQALKEVSDELKIAVIVQFSARYVKQFQKRFGFEFLIEKYRNNYMYYHLDHCQDLELIEFCIKIGFDGVMYDGSEHSICHNIDITRKVKDMAIPYNCIVEGELGEIGGVEDGEGGEQMSHANLNEVKEYVDKTDVDVLALGIGNAHGFYTTLKNIDTSLLLKAKKILNNNQFFVLHGGSGLPEEIVKETINYGVVKINYSTQIKETTNQALKEYMKKDELFNEINFENTLISRLKEVYIKLLKTYTI